MPATDAPTREQGSALGGNLAQVLALGRTGAGGYVPESFEDVPELTFPASASIYDRVRKDGQVAAMLRAIRLPILRADRHRLGDVDACRPEVIRMVEAMLGLGEGARAKPRGTGVDVLDVKRDALLMLPFGFMALEQSYDVRPAPPGLDVGIAGPVAFLKRLAPRMPRSIAEVRVDREGALIGIVQYVAGAPGDATRWVPPGQQLIEVDRLVMFVNEREGAEWTGNSILREAYKHWLIKDALLRVGPMVVERNGMGLPVVKYDDQGDRDTALGLAKAARMGAEAGVALGPGYSLELLGVKGTTRDELPLVKYHDEAIGRSALAMFLNLGHDNGARALGDTYVDYFILAEHAVDGYLNGIITEHIIRDLVELNYGPDEPYPCLTADPIDAEATPTAEALSILAAANLLGPIDDGIVAEVRRRYGMPAALPTATIPDTYQPAGEGPGEGPPVGLPVEDPNALPVAASDVLVDRLEAVTAQLAAIRAQRAGAGV